MKWLSYDGYFNKTIFFLLCPRNIIIYRLLYRDTVKVWMSKPRCAFFHLLGLEQGKDKILIEFYVILIEQKHVYFVESGYCTLFVCLHLFLSGRNKITKMISFLFSTFVGLKSFVYASVITLSPFLMNKDRNYT